HATVLKSAFETRKFGLNTETKPLPMARFSFSQRASQWLQRPRANSGPPGTEQRHRRQKLPNSGDAKVSL
ncbi:MAG: hypothetical protein WBM06_07320, partial [Pseudolabrys sp.]